MSPFTMVVPPVLPGTSGIFDAFSELSGSPNGSAVVNFTDSNVNMLPILPGPTKVGTHTFSIVDYTRSSLPFCDAGDIDNPDALCNQPREIRVSMLCVQDESPLHFLSSMMCCKLLMIYHEVILHALLR